jgi:hypothetical protein
METHPPKLIEALVAKLIPLACRENVIGDWAEQYRSPAQYLFSALAVLPFIVASQILRTFRLATFFSEAAVLYFAFAGASLAGSGGLNNQPLPLVIIIGIALIVLVVRDAYVNPEEQPARRALRDVGFSIGIAICCQGLLRDMQLSNLTLHPWLALAGSAVSIPMLYMVRRFFETFRENAAAPASGPVSSLSEHRKVWRLNLAWVIAGVIVIFTDPRINGPSPGSALTGLFLILALGISLWEHKNGFRGPVQEHSALSISGDPYRNQLARKRDGLRTWAGGGQFSLSRGGGATLILVVIASQFIPFLFRWITGRPLPPAVDSTHVSLSLIAYAILTAFWVFVRSRSLRAAQTIQDELDRLEAEDKKQ